MDFGMLFELIEAKKEEYLDFLKNVVEIESPTTYKNGVDAVGNYFIEKAKEHGWMTEIFEQKIVGNVVVITMNPDIDKDPVCLSGHIDTVYPLGYFGNPCVKLEENKLTGPGVADCKGGCVNAFWAMDALSQAGYKDRPVMLILQSDEETNGRDSNKATIKYILERSKNAVAFLNLEPCYSEKGVTLERRGIAKFDFAVKGKAAHASKCHLGASAIAEAASKILKLEEYKDVNGITCNCGTIKGGTVSNTVAEECVFTLDTRFKDTEQYEVVKKFVKKIAESRVINGTSCEVHEFGVRPPMPGSDKNYDLLKEVNEILKKAGLKELEVINSAGGSDAAYVTLAGIPVIDSIGVIGDKCHSSDEYILTDKFSLSTKRIAAIVACK